MRVLGMEAGEGSPPIDDGGGTPSSFLNLTGSEAYPKRALVSDDPSLVVPFPCLPGEAVEFLGRSTQGIVALSSYRFFLAGPEQQLNLPLGLLEAVECRDIFYLHLICKDARSFRCSFATNEDCQKWHKRLTNAIQLPKRLDDLFAFRFYLYCREERYDDLFSFLKSDRPSLEKDTSLLHQECKRMGFDTDLGGTWKISSINEKFKFCSSYPRYLIVPTSVPDQDLETVASFRYSRRIPTVVWRQAKWHHLYGTVIARSAQPEVGWLGWRSPQDENLIQAIADACSIDPGPAIGNGLDSLPDDQRLDSDASDLSMLNGGLTASMHFEPRPAPQRKMLILDARSYTAAVANRAKGGGCECPEYYPNCEVQFMSLANIHTIRKSFHASACPLLLHSRSVLSSLCIATCSWMSTLESSKWLYHLSGLLKASLVVANAVDLERRPVLVHCSDGWDRTPQIVAMAELILDPYYRTIEFGHKFGDRCGNSATADDLGERCPVFLQWLDCVHQLLTQFPCGFQFNQQYLVKLAQHTYSSLFGDFLGNSTMERQQEAVATRTFSVWTFLKARPEQYFNYLYSHTDQVLRPRCQVRDLRFWSEVYLQPSTGLLSQGPPSTPPSEAPEPAEETPPEPAGSGDTSTNLVKTKSVDSLFAGSQSEQTPPPEKHQRRLSDPSLKGLQSELHSGHDETATPLAHRRSLSNGALNSSHEEVAADAKTSLIVADSAEESVQHTEQQQQHAVSSIEDSTDTLVSEAGESCASAMTEAVQEQSEKDSEATAATAEAMMLSALPRQTHLLSNTASTSTTDISSSAVYNMFPEVAVEDLPSNKCPYWLTPSSGYPATPCDDRLLLDPVASRTTAAPLQQQQQFDVDGLACPVDAVQQRLHQMVLEHEAKIESLENELRRVRLALERSYLHVNGKETLESLEDAQLGLDCSGEPPWGGCQDGSSSSELSWEQVDERDARATLWVPDHAASHCRGCNAEFWIGRRRHHCRNCGHVFCNHCAEPAAPCSSRAAVSAGSRVWHVFRVAAQPPLPPVCSGPRKLPH
ncbi:hypothetical protein HPB49_022002 [Dermacentor silvarum]|uniref:Uncharacterized protein n=1 Tax=Dermacentor silvarum TaxID=543639 RepID=A0ACB8D8J2_DERSI|nr:hypothetical protein HPB49_022002 [Dermacentor silvarum]